MSGAMMGGNGSPTSNLFPSITSLFQSPIGTPRVTPTPQHFAAYLFNEDQFHSLILLIKKCFICLILEVEVCL